MIGMLTGEHGVGRNVGGAGGEVVYPDVSGSSDFFGHEYLAVRCLGRGTSD
jgi:hypothetical protein